MFLDYFYFSVDIYYLYSWYIWREITTKKKNIMLKHFSRTNKRHLLKNTKQEMKEKERLRSCCGKLSRAKILLDMDEVSTWMTWNRNIARPHRWQPAVLCGAQSHVLQPRWGEAQQWCSGTEDRWEHSSSLVLCFMSSSSEFEVPPLL